MITGDMAWEAYKKVAGEFNFKERWQAAADVVTAHEREAVVRLLKEQAALNATIAPAIEAALLIAADRINRGIQHVPPPKTPGQVQYESLAVAMGWIRIWDHLTAREKENHEKSARAVLDHAKEQK